MLKRPIIVLNPRERVKEIEFLSTLNYTLDHIEGWFWWRKKIYRITTEFKFRVNDWIITIKPGMLTDFASIPGPLKKLYSPTDPRWIKAALMHDECYESEIFEQWFCDRILDKGMDMEGSSDFDADAFWLAVDKFGGIVYGAHTEASVTAARTHLTIVKTDGTQVYPEII